MWNMRIKVVLGSLFLCYVNLTIAQQNVQVDSLDQIVDSPDSVFVVEDSISLVQADTVALQEVAEDSIAIALRPLTQVDVDSTRLVLEQVKALTDKISEQSFLNAHLVKEVFSDTAIVNKYNRLLDKMVMEYAAEAESINVDDTTHVNPLFFRLFAPLTLYKSPVAQAMTMDRFPSVTLEDSLRVAAMASGKDLRLLNELDRVLLSTYLSSPALVGLTENELKASQNFSEETKKKVSESVRLDVPTAVVAPLADTKPQAMTEVVVQKPNFWKTKGSFSTQMTESYFSPNWYQGGINNINMLSTMTLEASYDNKRKIQWHNKLEARIGFYQNEGAEIQSNQDLLRFTSKLNLKAIYNWNYTVEAQGNTQMMQHFNGDNTLKSRFMAPADGSLTIGMDYRKNFKKGSLSVFPGPLSYKVNYVALKELAGRYGMEEGKLSRHDLGSKLEMNFNYQLAKNISYRTRFYYYTGRYEYVQMDWENTFNFQVSKYISATLFFHCRYDDRIKPHEDWSYLQFKEYLTFGLNYSW